MNNQEIENVSQRYGVKWSGGIDVYPEDDARALALEDPEFYELVVVDKHDSSCHAWSPWWTGPYCTCGLDDRWEDGDDFLYV